jgi:hypothetical protein
MEKLRQGPVLHLGVKGLDDDDDDTYAILLVGHLYAICTCLNYFGITVLYQLLTL